MPKGFPLKRSLPGKGVAHWKMEGAKCISHSIRPNEAKRQRGSRIVVVVVVPGRSAGAGIVNISIRNRMEEPKTCLPGCRLGGKGWGSYS